MQDQAKCNTDSTSAPLRHEVLEVRCYEDLHNIPDSYRRFIEHVYKQTFVPKCFVGADSLNVCFVYYQQGCRYYPYYASDDNKLICKSCRFFNKSLLKRDFESLGWFASMHGCQGRQIKPKLPARLTASLQDLANTIREDRFFFDTADPFFTNMKAQLYPRSQNQQC
uniref:ATE_N domain-containing protein n=1 Tax=Panagrellus redivivus TaxID=6233 RepID=A0A7E4ZX70_PANRE